MNPTMVVAIVVGSITVIMIPTMLTILYSVASKQLDATKQNTLAIEKMSGKIELIWHIIGDVPELKKDMSFLKGEHSKRQERDN